MTTKIPHEARATLTVEYVDIVGNLVQSVTVTAVHPLGGNPRFRAQELAEMLYGPLPDRAKAKLLAGEGNA